MASRRPGDRPCPHCAAPLTPGARFLSHVRACVSGDAEAAARFVSVAEVRRRSNEKRAAEEGKRAQLRADLNAMELAARARDGETRRRERENERAQRERLALERRAAEEQRRRLRDETAARLKLGPPPDPRSAGAPLARVARRLPKRLCGVYVIRCEASGRYKIGKSTDVAARLRSHAASLTWNLPGRLRLERVIPCTPRTLGFLELAMHWIYDEGRTGAVEIFEAGLAPPPGSLRSAADVLDLFYRVAHGEILEQSRAPSGHSAPTVP